MTVFVAILRNIKIVESMANAMITWFWDIGFSQQFV